MLGASGRPLPEERPPNRGNSCPSGIPRSRPPEVVSFAELFEAAAEPDKPAIGHGRHRATSHRPRRPGRHRQPRPRTWICLAEWVLGGWARTLRAATLMALVAITVGAVASTLLGIYGTAAVAVLLALLHMLPQPERRAVLR